MELSPKQSELLSRRNLVILATSSVNAEPKAIIVEINKAEKDEIIITDNEMHGTKDNILNNKKVCILAYEENYHYGLKIFGEAQYFTNGEYFYFVKNFETNKDHKPKGAVVVKIKEVIEFK